VVLLFWGLFDDAVYVEHEGERSGPYAPVAGPIPLHRYRTFKRGKREERADRIRHTADQLTLPLAALTGDDLRLQPPPIPPPHPTQPFDADALEYHFPTTIAAKLAIAQELGLPLSKLAPDDRAFIDHVLEDTRMRRLVLGRVRDYFRAKPSGADHAG
jgi:putative transposase